MSVNHINTLHWHYLTGDFTLINDSVFLLFTGLLTFCTRTRNEHTPREYEKKLDSHKFRLDFKRKFHSKLFQYGSYRVHYTHVQYLRNDYVSKYTISLTVVKREGCSLCNCHGQCHAFLVKWSKYIPFVTRLMFRVYLSLRGSTVPFVASAKTQIKSHNQQKRTSIHLKGGEFRNRAE